MKKIKIISLLIIICSVSYMLYSIIAKINQTSEKEEKLVKMPKFSFTFLSGKEFSYSDLNQSKYTLFVYFNTTCVHCEKQIEYIVEKYEFLKEIQVIFAGRKQILQDVSFILKKGKLTVLAGESGSGKTTLGFILQKFYKPENGNIIINNSINLQDIDTNIWRSKIASVPQDIHIFNGNVIYNICLSNSQEEADKVMKFLNKNGFTKYIDGFPQSFLTLLGEEGANISGGQKQIIALARALYQNPQLLILDEASNAMDRETEKFTANLLNKIKSETAILLITHRLHTLKNLADEINIIEGGKINISGNHTELLKNDNIYSSYWNEILYS